MANKKMTIDEAIEQMESIIANAKDNLKDPMASDEWEKDIIACNMAIELFKKDRKNRIFSTLDKINEIEKKRKAAKKC